MNPLRHRRAARYFIIASKVAIHHLWLYATTCSTSRFCTGRKEWF